MFGLLKSIFNWLKKSPAPTDPDFGKKVVFSEASDPGLCKKSGFGLFYDLPLTLAAMLGTDGVLKAINTPWQELHNRSSEELTHLPFLSFIHPKDRKNVKEILSELKKKSLSVSFEARVLCKEKTPEWLHWRALSYPKEGNIYLICAPISDIKNELEKVRNSEAFYRELFEIAPDIIIQMDRLGFIKDANPASVKYTTYEIKDIIGKHFTQLPFMPASSARIGTVEFAALMTQGDNRQPFEIIIDRKDGKDMVLETNPRVIRRNNKYIGVMAMFRDVTERKHIEADLKRARDEALESAKLKSEFLANMSHEIRTPMNAIVGMAELLMDSPLNSDQRHYAETIVKSGESLLQIINDILDFSKMEAGKLEYREDEFNMRELAEEATELLAAKAYEKNLELGLLVPNNVHEAVIGDPLRLKQVLVNLINNAIKFTNKGEVVLKVHQKEDKNSAIVLRFEVADTGIGITEKDKAKLFQSFSQIDSSATRKYGGTGLGLAISKKIIEGLKGTMGVESEKGKGSIFWFELSFKKSRNSKKIQPTLLNSFEGLRTLLIDDNKLSHEILRHQMAQWGIRLDGSENGYQGLEKMEKAIEEQKPYDLVLLDMLMPRLNGLDVAKKIREHPQLADTKLILMSSLASPIKQDTLAESGVNAQLTKPVSQSLLFDTIATVLKGKILSEAPQQGGLGVDPGLQSDKSHFRILIVDDNQVNRELTLLQLNKLGFQAELAKNGLEALEAAQQHPYSLIFMDCQMPEMDGFTATQEIRKLEKNTRHTPIVGLTANAMEGDRKKCLSAGMDDYLSKPVKIEKLMKMIQKWDIPIDPIIQTNVKGNVGLENYGKLVAIYVQNSVSLIQSLKNHAASKNYAEIARVAHTLKGSSANMGARSLQILSDRLQRLAEEGKEDEVPPELERLEKESARVFESLQSGYDEAV